jgi:hypothetical protein
MSAGGGGGGGGGAGGGGGGRDKYGIFRTPLFGETRDN